MPLKLEYENNGFAIYSSESLRNYPEYIKMTDRKYYMMTDGKQPYLFDDLYKAFEYALLNIIKPKEFKKELTKMRQFIRIITENYEQKFNQVEDWY